MSWRCSSRRHGHGAPPRKGRRKAPGGSPSGSRRPSGYGNPPPPPGRRSARPGHRPSRKRRGHVPLPGAPGKSAPAAPDSSFYRGGGAPPPAERRPARRIRRSRRNYVYKRQGVILSPESTLSMPFSVS